MGKIHNSLEERKKIVFKQHHSQMKCQLNKGDAIIRLEKFGCLIIYWAGKHLKK